MKVLVVCAALLAAACSFNPVVTDPVVSDPEGSGVRYDDCHRAARDYCRDAVGVAKDEMKKCVAEATFECVSGRAK